MRRLDKLAARLPLALDGVEVPEQPAPLARPLVLAVFWKSCEVRGLIFSDVDTPGVPAGVGVARLDKDEDKSGARGRRASRAARRSRFVVPVDLDSPERAEQTTATLWPDSI
jgi:hypothetical protein